MSSCACLTECIFLGHIAPSSCVQHSQCCYTFAAVLQKHRDDSTNHWLLVTVAVHISDTQIL